MSYTIYGGTLSLFTRKLEAAMIFYGAEHVRADKHAANAALLETRSGTHQVPVLHTPENWMIADTTPLLWLLDARFPGREMFPSGELGALVHVIEEHLDEWIARVMVHWRWHYRESAEFAAQIISGGDPRAAARIVDWGPRACRATGTESPLQQQAAEDEYVRLLDMAETQLKDTAFLLGDRPTAVDCMFLGGLRAHTYRDPVPKRVVADFPTVVEWAERRADTWDGGGELARFPQSTAFARHVLKEMADTYGTFVLGNRDALQAGAKAFHVESYGEDVSYLTRPYPEQSRRMVGARLRDLPSTALDTWLAEYRLEPIFTV
ncbi:MAG: glutathione S-transferase family protein [Pseudomonadota bacterium]